MRHMASQAPPNLGLYELEIDYEANRLICEILTMLSFNLLLQGNNELWLHDISSYAISTVAISTVDNFNPISTILHFQLSAMST